MSWWGNIREFMDFQTGLEGSDADPANPTGAVGADCGIYTSPVGAVGPYCLGILGLNRVFGPEHS